MILFSMIAVESVKESMTNPRSVPGDGASTVIVKPLSLAFAMLVKRIVPLTEAGPERIVLLAPAPVRFTPDFMDTFSLYVPAATNTESPLLALLMAAWTVRQALAGDRQSQVLLPDGDTY